MSISSEEEELCFAAALSVFNAASINVQKKKIATKKRQWVKQWKLRRINKGSCNLLHQELRLEDPDAFRRFLRMNEDCFTELLELVKNDIERQDTKMRPSISAVDCLSCVLRFLATGESYRSTEYHTRISLSYISERVPEVCGVLYENLRNTYLQFPVGQKWESIAENFESRWQFPLCLGCIDGKHVGFSAAKTDGALYYNYKGFNSIVLLGVCDANYKFTYVDIGCNGRISDGGVLNRSSFRNVLSKGNEFFPKDKVIGNNRCLPYVVIGDDAFPLERHLMKPFPYHTQHASQKNFNYRLSRARQTIEHAFGILANRFRVLKGTICLRPHKVVKIVQACCVLHNFLAMKSIGYLVDPTLQENPEEGNQRIDNPRRHSNEAGKVRETFAEYFYNEGKIHF